MENHSIINKIFEDILPDLLRDNPQIEIKDPVSVQININGENGGSWIFDSKEQTKIISGKTGSPDCTITMNDTDFMRLIKKSKMDWGIAYLEGKIKINGGNSATARAFKILEKHFSRAKEALLKAGEINP